MNGRVAPVGLYSPEHTLTEEQARSSTIGSKAVFKTKHSRLGPGAYSPNHKLVEKSKRGASMGIPWSFYEKSKTPGVESLRVCRDSPAHEYTLPDKIADVACTKFSRASTGRDAKSLPRTASPPAKYKSVDMGELKAPTTHFQRPRGAGVTHANTSWGPPRASTRARFPVEKTLLMTDRVAGDIGR